MDSVAPQVVATTNHIRFLIFDWAVPNLIVGAILIAVFFLAAWARLPKWIEQGRDRQKGGKG